MATPLCYTVIIPFFIALFLVGWIHPKLVKIALLKNIVDNPDARKLQRTPVPVLGGVAVFFGVVIAIGCMSAVVDCSGLPVVIMAMMAMLYTGTMDDILNLSPSLRLLIEIVVVLLLVFVGGYCINDFHGLWGIGPISPWCAVPLTVFATVGIINAINLVDGVNGLSSGYCIMACTIFGILFHLAGEEAMTILAVVSVGALIPFFLHNVFGKTSKMFIGDGGTLVMGTVMSVFVIAILQSGSRVAAFGRPQCRACTVHAGGVVGSRVRYAARDVDAYAEGLVAIPSRQDAPAPYVHRHGLFPCRDDIGYLGIEYGGRIMLVGVRSGRFFNRRSTVCCRRHEPSGHVRVVSFHAMAYPPRHEIHGHYPPAGVQDPYQPYRNFFLVAAGHG